ncbi:MAG: hypothetical protein EXR86_12750 [Gammaproteobacteria bacterium]|nr:hypothetical protein [Gammaproteobacteria bacterium]
MEMWMKILSALFLGLMLIALLPRAKAMMETSPNAGPGDWRSALLPIAAVIGFVIFLMAVV